MIQLSTDRCFVVMQFLHLHKSKTRWWFQIFFYFYPYLGKWWNLTNIFQVGWNHQLEKTFVRNIRVSWLHSWILEVLLGMVLTVGFWGNKITSPHWCQDFIPETREIAINFCFDHDVLILRLRVFVLLSSLFSWICFILIEAYVSLTRTVAAACCISLTGGVWRCIYTWNPKETSIFWRVFSTQKQGRNSNQNKGLWGSRYILYIYITFHSWEWKWAGNPGRSWSANLPILSGSVPSRQDYSGGGVNVSWRELSVFCMSRSLWSVWMMRKISHSSSVYLEDGLPVSFSGDRITPICISAM